MDREFIAGGICLGCFLVRDTGGGTYLALTTVKVNKSHNKIDSNNH